MAKTKRMDQIKELLRTYQACGSFKQTGRILNMSKNTVKKYIRRLEQDQISLETALQMEESELQKVVLKPLPANEQNRLSHLESQLDYWLSELRRVGVTRQLLWEEYRQQTPSGYGYSQFCEYLRRAARRKDVTLQIQHVPGEVMQLDFAGKSLSWIDLQTGEVMKCEVLIAVFPHSQYTFAIALPSQQIADFIYGINEAFLFFGGLSQVILSDNLKSYVSKADRYDPTFTQLCEQLGAHFQVDLQATRAGKPKDKGSVENAVRIAYQRIYAPLRNENFFSLEELNAAIRTQLDVHNKKAYQKKEGSRYDVFHQYELPQMRPLPSELFELKKIVKAKVQRNYHIMLGEEKNFYSVPHQYVGRNAQVVYTARTVSVFIDNQRIAIHKRLLRRGYNYQTKPEHMPPAHQKWKEIKGYDASHFLQKAQRIGPATHWAIERILISRIHEQQTYNSCLGVIRLGEKHTPERLEKAALRCQVVDQVSYSMLKRILDLKLDTQTQSEEQLTLPLHDNIRGADAYQ